MEAWNKGLTKKTDERVKGLARTLSQSKRVNTDYPIQQLEINKDAIIYNIHTAIEKKIIKHDGVIYIGERDYKDLMRDIEFIIKDVKCYHCNTTDTKLIEKEGTRKTGYKKNSRYFCNKCKKRFTVGGQYFRMKYTPQIIELSKKLYFNKYTSRDIRDIIKILYNIKVSHTSITRWSKKDMARVGKYISEEHRRKDNSN